MNKFIKHYGIKGQRWGVRRWQNEDGSLTTAGKKKYGSSTPNMSTADLSKLVKRQKLEAEYEKINPSKEKQQKKEIAGIGKEAQNIDRELSKIGSGPKTKVVTKDYSDISNEELKRRIERLNLESNYGRLTGDTKMIRSGSDWFREILQSGAALTAIGSSAAAIYVSLKNLKS